MKISQPEHGGNGVWSRMVNVCPCVVNEWLLRASVDLGAYAIDIGRACRLLVPLSDNLLQQIITHAPSTNPSVNLFDCASLQSFCGCRGA
jgi:hypothetical protein